MQTATVDIRRLQILNDSINRTIEALHQVRLSVYGAVAPSMVGVSPAVGGLAHASPIANALANPFAFVGSGLGHSAVGVPFADPYTSARIAQTFPFLHWGYSPFASPTTTY